jgi:hypothetical protein
MWRVAQEGEDWTYLFIGCYTWGLEGGEDETGRRGVKMKKCFASFITYLDLQTMPLFVPLDSNPGVSHFIPLEASTEDEIISMSRLD